LYLSFLFFFWATKYNTIVSNSFLIKKLTCIFALDRLQFDLANIPKIFLMPSLDLSQRNNFDAVFPFAKDGLLTEECNIVLHVKQMQEKVWL